MPRRHGPDLFAWVPPPPRAPEAFARASDPGPSHEAADKMRQSQLERIVYEAMVLIGHPVSSLCIVRYLRQRGGGTAWSVSPRLAPLERKGLVERCGTMAVVNSSGRLASLTAWRVVDPTRPWTRTAELILPELSDALPAGGGA